MDRSELVARYQDLPGRDTWINEAFFGFEHVKPYLDTLNAGDAVLEVGSGSGILLSLIQSDYPLLRTAGVEPIGEGFNSLAPYHELLEQHGVPIHPCGYEDLQPAQPYKLIFLVNVFEHLPDWRHFLQFIKRQLSEDGRCVILCPNYGFPYESHFRLPVIFSKRLTYRIFKNKIHAYESQRNCIGLWKSLNFVTCARVRQECKEAGLLFTYDTRIIMSMIDRLEADDSFKARQGTLARIARLVKASGVLYFLRWSIIQDLAPYMKLEIRHSDVTG